MIISLDWLKSFLDFEESPKELAEILSNIGLEAEVNKDFSKTKNKVVIKNRNSIVFPEV